MDLIEINRGILHMRIYDKHKKKSCEAKHVRRKYQIARPPNIDIK